MPDVVAVSTGYKRHGYARLLKEFMVEQARLVGAAAVMSYVHWDNEAMLRLNRSFGANLHREAGGNDYCLCVIPLRWVERYAVGAAPIAHVVRA